MAQETIHIPDQLTARERAMLTDKIKAVIDEAVQQHGRDEQGDSSSLMDLAGSLASDMPRLTDEQERQAIAEHIRRENPRPGE